jgi:hypothetical protein
MDRINVLEKEFTDEVGANLTILKLGGFPRCNDRQKLRNTIFIERFKSFIKNMPPLPDVVVPTPVSIGMGSYKVVTLSDFNEDGYTYINPQYAGQTFGVYYNNGNRFLDEDNEGFKVLSGGGFQFDPTKFTLLPNEKLRIII